MSDSILPGRLDGLSLEAGGRRLIDGLSLTLEAGPRTVILGPNGAGKSLTLRLAHGLIAPSAGRVAWQRRDAARRQALVFQRPVMLRRSAAANIDYALALRGLDRAERARRRDRVLERTGLIDLARRSARVLSVGEQQRVEILRALYRGADILLLDEPTATLTPVEVAHRSTSITLLGGICLQLGRKLEWDPKAERFVNDDAANALLDYEHRAPWRV